MVGNDCVHVNSQALNRATRNTLALILLAMLSLGTFIGGGATYHLVRMVGMIKAKELVYTGRILNGMEAVKLGLAVHCYPIGTLMAETLTFAGHLAEKAPYSMELAKRRLQQSFSLDLETVLDLETEAILSCMRTEDWHEGIQAFNEKRKPIFKGR